MRPMPSPAASSPAPSPAPGQLHRRRLRPARRSPHDAEILRLAVPAFGALVAEPLFLFADSVIVGRLGTALRGLQDTRTPLAVAVAANVVNVALNVFLVLGLHWGIAGSAWGTVCAQTAAAAAYLAVVARGARRAGVGFAPGRTGLRAAAVTG